MADSSNELKVKGVMVGVLRNRKQLDYNLMYGFYHIPEEWVPEYRLPIKYVALYQSPHLFDKGETGIFRYGRVIRTELIPRREIENIPTIQDLSGLYYRFFVDKWCELQNPIRVSNLAPDVNVFTDEDNFFGAKNVSELFIEREDQRRFYKACKERFEKVKLLSMGYGVDAVCFDEFAACWEKEKIVILKGKKRIMKVKADKLITEGVEKLLSQIKEKADKYSKRKG